MENTRTVAQEDTPAEMVATNVRLRADLHEWARNLALDAQRDRLDRPTITSLVNDGVELLYMYRKGGKPALDRAVKALEQKG